MAFAVFGRNDSANSKDDPMKSSVLRSVIVVRMGGSCMTLGSVGSLIGDWAYRRKENLEKFTTDIRLLHRVDIVGARQSMWSKVVNHKNTTAVMKLR